MYTMLLSGGIMYTMLLSGGIMYTNTRCLVTENYFFKLEYDTSQH